MAHDLEIADGVVVVVLGVGAQRLQVVRVRDEVSKPGEVEVAPALRIEIARRLPDVLAPLRLGQAVDGVVAVFTDRLDGLIVVSEAVQRRIFDARDVAGRVVGVVQVLHHGRIGEDGCEPFNPTGRIVFSWLRRKVSGSYS